MDYKALAEYRNTNNPFAMHTGCTVKEISKGRAVVEHNPENHSLNPLNAVHGGLLYTMADIAAGNAACSYGNHAATVNSSFNYLRPALNAEKLIATGVESKHGKNLMVIEVTIEDQEGVILCTGTFTYMNLDIPVDTKK